MSSDLGIRDLYHIAYTCPDLSSAEEWWQTALRARFYKKIDYMEVEKRSASFVRLAGLTIEPMTADVPEPGAALTPLQRFVDKFGSRWYSIAWFVSDLPDLYSRLTHAGVRLFAEGGGDASQQLTRAVYTHPRDTFVALQMVAGLEDGARGDAARIAALDSDGSNPLGIEKLAWLTAIPQDVEGAVAFYTATLGGEVVEVSTDEFMGTTSTFVRVGPTVLEFAAPTRSDNLLGADSARRDVLHSINFTVQNLDKLRSEFDRHGVPIVASDASHLIIAAPSATDARIGFTERSLC